MDIDNRIEEATQKFENLKEQRNKLLSDAEEILSEMTKLQGEYRVLVELQENSKVKKAEVIDEANTIVAKPEKEKK